MAVSRVFLTKWFQRSARKEEISTATLLDAVERAENGQIAADLGGSVIKQRISRPGQGKSGGYRTIIVFRKGDRAVFMYVFPKNERDNITTDELVAFREAAKYILALSDHQIAALTKKGDLVEVKRT
ncbi:MAG: type II toxin-antitoxin system RelE/ParE family toxin [Bryobacterales bacterium]|nr:type II toxin-antitoxin system RelE/ParE family toxin [Bryobacterales bacterium]